MWPTNKKEHAYMKGRQKENKKRSKTNKAENWAKERLAVTGLKWTRQAQWGYRVFDFWCHEKGIAVEVDGATHNQEYDSSRDQKNYETSGILVLRVKNYDEGDMDIALLEIESSGTWNDRRSKLGLKPITYKGK